MKHYFFIVIGLLLCSNAKCQNEFKTYDNGLIYSKPIMTKLSKIVTDLNLKYKSCELKTFYAKPQTIGHYFKLEGSLAKQAKQDLANKISFDDFVKKYPLAKVSKNILIVKFRYKNYKNKNEIVFREVNPNGDGYEFTTTNTNLYFDNMANQWLFNYYKKDDYSSESITSFFFPENFKSISLPEKYSRMVGYADCLIDTTETKIYKDAVHGSISLPENYEKLGQNEKADILEEMRKTKVVGGCSMDESPRIHAINIAVLSAETTNWEVFLKAHLDIMNDKFERISDGSYAWARRETYIKELEELDINVKDLIFGISLRVENVSENHYNGNISRIGRALAESKFKNDIENEMILIIENTLLDDYNRLIAYFLFDNYIYYLKDGKDESVNKIKKATESLPEYLKQKIKHDYK